MRNGFLAPIHIRYKIFPEVRDSQQHASRGLHVHSSGPQGLVLTRVHYWLVIPTLQCFRVPDDDLLDLILWTLN